MRSLVESTTRWQETTKHSSSLADLQRAVKFNGPNSPCVAGCRSICWKAFLLGHGSGAATNWSHSLLESRSTYASLRDHFLKYIKHPEYLASVETDPLADDADSPWNTLRQDEVLRAEILQDVQRLPDEPFYHEPHVQTLILDVLFIYCKLNPDIGGYRQGMHELLAPILYVVEQDAINPVEAASKSSADLTMIEMLDAAFIEHDVFALFSKLMEPAKVFYKNVEEQKNGQNIIVEKSQRIHEVLLYKADPALSNHLKNIEVLPQIFLIRWIRLLFSREFPFDQMLVLWDTLFSVDPSLQLIDLVCTAMLIRIRWELLGADYSVALQLLLKYPAPQDAHGPHTFVDDALYLMDHLSPAGGSALILKYTGKLPTTHSTSSARPSTPKTFGLSMRHNSKGVRSPLSPSGGVEALFQGAAKGVLERGEKLGINQAVRDALVEIRRNVNEASRSMKASSRDLFSEQPNTSSESSNSPSMRALAAMDRRNKQLAAMLDESITSLRTLATADIDDSKKHGEDFEISAAKIQFVKVCLEDSTIALPEPNPLASPQSMASDTHSNDIPTEAVAAMKISSPKIAIDSPNPERESKTSAIITPLPPATTVLGNSTDFPADAMDTDDPLSPSSSQIAAPTSRIIQRPPGPIPTRSTLAQSSFSWMLEPDESPSSFMSQNHEVFSTSSSASSSRLTKQSSSDSHSQRKRPSANASRERTAFLFGEVPLDASGKPTLSGDLFGLEPLRKDKG